MGSSFSRPRRSILPTDLHFSRHCDKLNRRVGRCAADFKHRQQRHRPSPVCQTLGMDTLRLRVLEPVINIRGRNGIRHAGIRGKKEKRRPELARQSELVELTTSTCFSCLVPESRPGSQAALSCKHARTCFRLPLSLIRPRPDIFFVPVHNSPRTCLSARHNCFCARFRFVVFLYYANAQT